MPATLHLFTDFVCPFCFIAEQSTVPQLLREFDLQLDWCGFELHPGTPLGGRPLAQLFPGVDLRALHQQTKRFAASFGVTGFEPPNRLHNSRRALALAEVAREHDRLEPLREAAFDAHWRHGADLESDDTLRGLAERAGLAADAALAQASSASVIARVDARQQQARRNGISGIPTFVVGQVRVVGCQPYATLAAAVERAGVKRRAGAAR